MILAPMAYYGKLAPKIRCRKTLASHTVIFSFRELQMLSSLPVVCICSGGWSFSSVWLFVWSCLFLCPGTQEVVVRKALCFMPRVRTLGLLVFLVICSIVDWISHIETSWNTRGFWKPEVNCIDVFQDWRGHCNSNNSKFQLQTPLLFSWLQGKAQIKRLIFQTYLKTAGSP